MIYSAVELETYVSTTKRNQLISLHFLIAGRTDGVYGIVLLFGWRFSLAIKSQRFIFILFF